MVNLRRKSNILNFFRKRTTKTKRFDQPVHAVDELNHEHNIVEDSVEPRIYTRSEHNISRKQINVNALKVLYRLREEGYAAYLVGGCVRDLLLGREPKDFDVATNASPEDVRAVFRNCRLIGRRFRLAHVFFGRDIIEVATFRGSDRYEGHAKKDAEGRLLDDNHYGTIAEDAMRRDFTVNALYYNIEDFSIVDYVGGMEDHRAGVMRLIGEPERRYREDPVRMIRLLRFSVKLGFTIDEASEQPLFKLANLLANIPPARLYDESLKLFLTGYGLQTFERLRHYDLFKYLFPIADKTLGEEEQHFPHVFMTKALANTDERMSSEQNISPYFLMAVFLWDAVRASAEEKIAAGLPYTIAYQQSSSEVISEQQKSTACAKHISMAMRDVWILQARFLYRHGNKAFRLLEHPKFRAGYDFFCLRAETGGAETEIAQWWTEFQTLSEPKQREMVASLQNKGARKRRRRRKPKAKVVS